MLKMRYVDIVYNCNKFDGLSVPIPTFPSPFIVILTVEASVQSVVVENCKLPTFLPAVIDGILGHPAAVKAGIPNAICDT